MPDEESALHLLFLTIDKLNNIKPLQSGKGWWKSCQKGVTISYLLEEYYHTFHFYRNQVFVFYELRVINGSAC